MQVSLVIVRPNGSFNRFASPLSQQATSMWYSRLNFIEPSGRTLWTPMSPSTLRETDSPNWDRLPGTAVSAAAEPQSWPTQGARSLARRGRAGGVSSCDRYLSG